MSWVLVSERMAQQQRKRRGGGEPDISGDVVEILKQNLGEVIEVRQKANRLNGQDFCMSGFGHICLLLLLERAEAALGHCRKPSKECVHCQLQPLPDSNGQSSASDRNTAECAERLASAL